VLLDGEHLIEEAMRAGVPVEAVLTDGQHRALDRTFEARGIICHAATAPVLAAASPVRTPSGIVAIAAWTMTGLDEVFTRAPALVVGMVGVQDPGNVGSVIRSAHALGATGVLALDGTADPAGWKALRGAMGSAFHLPVGAGTVDDAFYQAAARHVDVVAMVAHGGTPLPQARLSPPILVLVGNEGHGLEPSVAARATHRVHVPMQAGVESLNVAVSAALALWEIRR
jgi:TrmH family RNA methyltransferase